MAAEKDYWVVRTLQAIADATALSGQFVFKGGTSLSKAWRLIDRLSEDIDLLLTGPDLGPMPTRSADRARWFKAVRTAVEEATPLRLPLDGLNEEDKRAYYLRSDTHGYMRYPLDGRRLTPGDRSEEWLLVEAGFRGGSHPSTVATFGSYLGTPKRQHWVPRFYLRGFRAPSSSPGGEAQVWLFRREDGDPVLTSIENVGVKSHLYSPSSKQRWSDSLGTSTRFGNPISSPGRTLGSSEPLGPQQPGRSGNSRLARSGIIHPPRPA
jgi:hypothetical protein